jgi:hypothetical protein
MLVGDQVTLSTQLAKAKADYAVVTSTLISAGLILGMLVCTGIIVGVGLKVCLKGAGYVEEGEQVPEVEGEAAV